MIVMYDADGTLHEGPELVKRLNDGTLSEDDILRFAKLALQPSAPTMDIYNKVAAHLTHCGKTTEEMIADYLQRLLDRAKASIKQTMYGDVSKVPTHVFLSVPQVRPSMSTTPRKLMLILYARFGLLSRTWL